MTVFISQQRPSKSILHLPPLVIRAPVSMEVDAELWVVVPDTTVSVAGAGLDRTVKLNEVSFVNLLVVIV